MPEETKTVIADGKRVRIRISSTIDYSKPVILLFHGYSFSLDVWETTGTLDSILQHQFSYLAIDLPRGKATKSQKFEKKAVAEYAPFLREVIRQSGIDFEKSKFVIIGPSMGGAFALAFAMENPERVLGLVLIAPSLSGVDEERLENLEVPVLLVWGDKDIVFPVEQYGKVLKQALSHSKLLIIKGAKHPAYLDQPQEFHDLLFDFIEEIS